MLQDLPLCRSRAWSLSSAWVAPQGGEVIQQLRQATGARIRVEQQVAGCEERVVNISSPDDPDSEWCPAQAALFRVHECILEGEAKDSEAVGQAAVSLLANPA